MNRQKHKILLVEDNRLDRMAFERLVESEKIPYEYKTAESVAEARELLAAEQFDVVISDYSLGDGTGMEVIELAGNTPVILVTGAGDEEVAVQAYRAGAADYLIKDLDRSYLKTLPITVENVVKHKQMQDQMQLLSAAVTSTKECIYITDLEDRIIFVNKAFCKNYGYEEQEVLGRHSNILWIGKGEGTSTRSVFRTGFTGTDWEIAFYHKRKDGSIFPASVSRSIVKDERGNSLAVVGVVRDITELVRVEDKIKALNRKLEQQSGIRA